MMKGNPDVPERPAGLSRTTSAGAIMGIYDREYYRERTRGSGWLSGAAPACKAIIVINVAVFVAQNSSARARSIEWFAADSDLIFHEARSGGCSPPRSCTPDSRRISC